MDYSLATRKFYMGVCPWKDAVGKGNGDPYTALDLLHVLPAPEIAELRELMRSDDQ